MTGGDHLASRRMLAKCGFRVVGRDRGYGNARGNAPGEVILRPDAGGRAAGIVISVATGPNNPSIGAGKGGCCAQRSAAGTIAFNAQAGPAHARFLVASTSRAGARSPVQLIMRGASSSARVKPRAA